MKSMSQRVLGVLAGRDMPLGLLARWASSADLLVAADSGGDTLLEAGYRPHVLLGDLDSASETARDAAHALLERPDQSSTDCDKLLHHLHEIGVGAVTLAAVEGDLPDHVLGTVHSAAKGASTFDMRVRLAFRRGIGFIVARHAVVSTVPGRRISVLPVTECLGVRLEGVRWPLEGAELHPMGLTSLSNQAAASQVKLEIGQGVALLFAEMPDEEMPAW